MSIEGREYAREVAAKFTGKALLPSDLELAYDAGYQSAQQEARKVLKKALDTLLESPDIDPETSQSRIDKVYRVLIKELYNG